MSQFPDCTVTIRVIEAKNLPKMDNVGWCDPYFVIRIGNQTQQTKIIKNTANPKYNAEFIFNVQSNTRVIEIKCFDWDKLSQDELISTIYIKFEEFEKDSPVIKWFSLGDKKGEVFLDIAAEFSLKRSLIPSSHPLVVYALSNYTPPPTQNPGEQILDEGQQPLQKGLKDMELKENHAYLVKRADYPWPEWSTLVRLQKATSQEETIYFAKRTCVPEPLLALADLTNIIGGYAPSAHFDPTRVSNAQSTLLSNPDSSAQVIKTLVASPDNKVQRNYIPASHPLVVCAVHYYSPPAPTGEALSDCLGLPLEKGFTDMALEAEGGVYLLKQVDYPWPDWCVLTPLRYAHDGEGAELVEGKSGLDAQLLYLANPRTAMRGGFAPISYIDPACVTAAKAELKKNSASFYQTIALLTAPPPAVEGK